MEQPDVVPHPYCYGCGDSNPVGLKLKHRLKEGVIVTEFVPQVEHQGWPGITHGGILLSLLYEVAENQPYQRGLAPMMKSIDTRFRRPAKVGETIIAKAWLAQESGREIHVAATLSTVSGQLLSEATAVLVMLSDEQKSRLGID